LWLAIQTTPVQNMLVKYSAKKLSAALGTTVEVKHVKFSFLNSADIEGVFVGDKRKDTLLYAGQLKVRITDWFIFKDKADLKFIALEDAVIKLHRTDSIWNYQFLVDYFSSPSPSKRKEKSGLLLSLKKIDLKNIHFINDDRWIGETIDTKISSLILNADDIDFDKGIFKLADATIEKPIVIIQNYAALRPKKIKKISIDTGYRLNPARLFLQVKNLTINNGSFIDDVNQKKPLQIFDTRHLGFTKINGVFNNVLLNNDTLTANMQLSCKERSGLEVKKLAADFKVHPAIMEFKNLDLQTNKSKISNYYAMRFDHFEDDFANYENKVIMNANFKNATIYSSDLGYFESSLKKINRAIDLSGLFEGTVANFSVKQLFAKSNNTSISGNLAMVGLPDIDKTIIDLSNGNVQTNATDLADFVPSINTFNNPDIPALGNIAFKGNFKGLYHNFKTNGNITTNLGAIYTNLSLQFPNGKEPSYSGVLSTSRFQLGRFIRDKNIGIIEFEGKVAGNSFTLDKMKTSLDGTVKQFQYNGYNYTNITTISTFEKKEFYGQVKIADSNLDFIGSIQIDVSGDQPRFNLFADIIKSNYQALNITKDDLKITGTLDVNFTGTNIDNFSGEAKLLNAVVENNGASIKFDSLTLASNYINNKKYLRLGSTDLQANIIGDFSIIDLPQSFQSFLHKYYPAYINEPSRIPKNQNFTFNISTGYFEPYLKLLDKKLSGLNDATFNGSINTQQNKLGITVSMPNFTYDTYSFYGVQLKGEGDLDSLSLLTTIDNTKVGDSINLPMITINVNSANDHSIVNVQTSANNSLNDASLVADVFTLYDGVRVQFRPSSFVINDKKWNIEKEGELVARKNFIGAKHLKFVQGYQEITIETENEEDNNASHVNVQLKSVLLGDFVGYAFSDPKIQGIATGKIRLNNLYGDFSASTQLGVEQFRLDEDSIGIAKIKASYDDKTGVVKWDWESPNKDYLFTAKGSYETKDSTSAEPLKTDVVLNNTSLKLVEKYLKGIFSDVSGFASGTLKVSGRGNDINLLGDVTIKNAGMLVDYTQVYYFIDSALVKFEKDGMNFGSFNIRDKFNNKGFVKGKLYEQFFKNMVFDFELNTPKLLLLDTKQTDNQQFYGTARGKASLSFKGPENNAKMIIVGEANDSSHIFIPNSNSRESADADFIVFKQFGEEMDVATNKNAFNLSVDLDLVANNKVAIDVILDDLTGDVIKATGNGRLRIKAGTNEKLDIRGRYNIENGKYDFNFQSLIKKPFLLLPGSGNYIEWTGDAMNADLHIDAQYEAENVSLADLINNTSFTANDNTIKAQRGPVYVIAQLRDKLTQPTIKFKIDFPQNSPAKTDPNFTQFLSRIETDDNEMITQATSLIVFNSFVPYGQGLLSGGGAGLNYGSIGINTISQKVTAEINKQVSNFLYRLFKDKSLKFDLGTATYSSGSIFNNGVNATSSRIDRQRVNFKIGRSFFNNNVVVTFGGDLDFGWGATTAQDGNFQWLPDLNVEVVLSKDKKLRAIVFNKNSLDISGNAFGRRNRQGVSISYRQEFETLFGKKEEEYFVPLPVQIEPEMLPRKDSTKINPTTQVGGK
jgi:hypothetical protein